MPYYLNNAFLLDNPWITVVGCGGTGGFVAEGLCRLFQGRQATIVLVDLDRVEPHNLLRQNFYPERRGQASRARSWQTGWRRAYGRPVGYSVYPFREYDTDSRTDMDMATPASSRLRREPDHRLRRQRRRTSGHGRVPAGSTRRRWLIDAGNDTNWGQVLVGNVSEPGGPGRSLPSQGETCYLAPGAHAPAPRPADGRLDQAAGRGLRGRPRPHRPGPHHQPDDGLAGAYRWSAVWWRAPAPSWPSTWTWTRARSARPTSPRRRWRGR